MNIKFIPRLIVKKVKLSNYSQMKPCMVPLLSLR